MDVKGITVKEEAGQLIVSCPFSPAFSAAARALGGIVKPGSHRGEWHFTEHHDQVKRILVDLFGTDGSDKPELITVYITISPSAARQTRLWLGGWLVANRSAHNSPPWLAHGVRVVDGPGFPDEVGDVLYPPLGGEGTVLEITDFPKRLAGRLKLESGAPAPAVNGPGDIGLLVADINGRLKELYPILAARPDSGLGNAAWEALDRAIKQVTDLLYLIRAL